MTAAAATETIDTYCEAWSHSDPTVRAQLLKRVWAPGATYVDPTTRTVGSDALLQHISTVLEKRPGARVIRTSSLDLHHDVARFAWHVVEANGNALPEGLDVVYMSADGKAILGIVGFFGALKR